MTNAKEEFIEEVKNHKVLWSKIQYKESYDNPQYYILNPNYTEQEYLEFLNSLNFEYDSGYGGRELFGIIACDNGVWFSRGEYDGSEWWELNKYPEFPVENIKK